MTEIERVYQPAAIPPDYPGGEAAYESAAQIVLRDFQVDPGVYRLMGGPQWRPPDQPAPVVDGVEVLADAVYRGFGVAALMRIGAEESYVAFLVDDPKDLLDTATRARYESKVHRSVERGLQDHQFSGTPAAIAKVEKIDERSALMIFRMGWRAGVGEADYAHSPLLGVVTE